MSDTKDKSKRRRKKAKDKAEARAHWETLETADRHDLYERSVQNTEAEIDFVEQVWSDIRGRTATVLREDFCGTAQTSAEWLRRREDNLSIGVDLDEEVVAWGMNKNHERLTEEQLERLEIRLENVLDVSTQPVDTVLAMNFSYFLFKTREDLRGYFEKVHASLVEDGLFVLDAYGGSDSFTEMEEERDLDGFTYVWDQNHYNPINGDVVNKIHFHFPDGTKMKDAFIYEWRLWTLPEITEILVEAGFSKASVYWEGTEEDGEDGNGEFTAETVGEPCAGWIVYIVAEK
jgi:SAM-dependent methyltransferase